MTLPNGAYWEPVHLGDSDARIKWFALVREPGEPPRIEGFMTAIGPDAIITLDAIRGGQGEKGESAAIIRRQWPPLSDPGDLPDVATLDETDDGRAWYINGFWHVYDDGEYHVIQGSVPGPRGATPDLSVTAEVVESTDPVTYGPITVTMSGPDASPNAHIEIPGIPGPEGPAAAIAVASDMDDTTIGDNDIGQVVAVTAVDVEGNPTFGVVTPAFLSPQIYTLPHNSFVDHTGSEGRFLIGSLNIPAKDFDWYPDVDGFARLSRPSFLSSVQCEIEVRVGITGAGTGETEQLCGVAPYDPTIALLDAATIAHIHPCWSDTLNPSFALDPDTGAGRVDAGDAVTFYVFVHKIAGTGSYQFTKANTGAHLRVQVNPIAG